MFKKTHTLYLKEENIKFVHAIMESLGLKVKHYRDLNRTYLKCDFKGTDKDVMSICTRLDKYGIEHAHF